MRLRIPDEDPERSAAQAMIALCLLALVLTGFIIGIGQLA